MLPRKAFRRGLRRDATPAERRLWQVLRNRRLEGRKFPFGNLRFRRQHPIGRYVVDFYCAEECLAIELDGAVHADPARAEADAQRQRAIEAAGVRLLRFENREVLVTPDLVAAAIASCFRERREEKPG